VIADHQARRIVAAPTGASRRHARPRAAAILCVIVLAATGWLYLALMVAGAARGGVAGALGPGMGIFDWLIAPSGFSGRLIDALCRPMFASAMPAGLRGAVDLALILLMWCAMALAMMLPTAGPMFLTYADIAETASRKGEPVVPPVVLAAGYSAIWVGFAIAATLMQWGLIRAAMLDPALKPASGLFSGAVFLLAGGYQFSALKHACVTLCQRPFPFFFANWTEKPAAVFRLGLRQGLYCLGCCWAMMLVMFAVGVMNVVWMAAIGVVMAIEKVTTTMRTSRIVGAALIGIGLVFVVSSVVMHWPMGSG
jgi:predicted metal-binding membrane protein